MGRPLRFFRTATTTTTARGKRRATPLVNHEREGREEATSPATPLPKPRAANREGRPARGREGWKLLRHN